jgi:hypothetical protein
MDALDGALGGDPMAGDGQDMPPTDDPMGDTMDASLASQDGSEAPMGGDQSEGMADAGPKPEDEEEAAPTFDDAG